MPKKKENKVVSFLKDVTIILGKVIETISIIIPIIIGVGQIWKKK